MPRKTKAKHKSFDPSLLLLLDKIDGELCKLEKQSKLQMREKYYQRRATIKKIYEQQHLIFIQEKNQKVALSVAMRTISALSSVVKR